MKYLWGGFMGLVSLLGVAEAQTVIKGQPATFRAKTTNVQTFEWTFPGGVIINGEVVRFTFDQAGAQDVTLKVTGLDGSQNQVTKRILVENHDRPTAVITALLDGAPVLADQIRATTAQTIDLQSSSFFGDKADQDFNLIWSVNDRDFAADQVTGAFDAVGTYTVKLSVEDKLDPRLKDQAVLRVNIVNQAPVVQSLTVTPLSNLPGQVQLQAAADDVDGTISSYKFEVLERGRPVMAQVLATDTTVFDVSGFPGDRQYSFRVTATDDRFDSHRLTASQTFDFSTAGNNQAPTALIQALPGNQGDTNTWFTFGTNADDPDGDVLRYEWILSTGERFFSSQFKHRFAQAGTYDVQLNVTDGLDKITDTVQVTINPTTQNSATNQAPTVNIAGVLPSQKGGVNTTFRFYLEAQDADLDRLQYRWDFGNGHSSFTKNAAMLYPEPGNYTVMVEVSDGELSAQDQITVTVEAAPNALPAETLEERLARLKTEAAEAESLAQAGRGQLTAAQQAVVDAMDGELETLLAARTAENQGARAESQAKLAAYKAARQAEISLLEQSRALGESLSQGVTRLQAERDDLLQQAQAAQAAGRAGLAQNLSDREARLSAALLEIQQAQASGETLEDRINRLNTRAQIATEGSQASLLAAQGQTEQAFIDRKNFVNQRIAELENLQANPVNLPSLGIVRQGTEVLTERIDRLQNQADLAAAQAQDRQALALGLAASRQQEYTSLLAELQARLAAEQDATRRAALEKQIGIVQNDIAKLAALQAPTQQLTPAEVESQTESLHSAAEALRQTVLAQQQDYLTKELREVDNQLAVSADANERAVLQAKKNRLEAEIDHNEIFSEYEAQLRARQKYLTQQIAVTQNRNDRYLLENQLQSVETKLATFAELKEAEQAVSDFKAATNRDPQADFQQFLAQEKTRLSQALSRVRLALVSETDPLKRQSLMARETEILQELKQFPVAAEPFVAASVPLVVAMDYLERYRRQQLDALQNSAETGAGVAVQTTVATLDSHLSALRRFDQSGYSPQTKLSTLQFDLEKKEAELLEAYRQTTDADTLEELRTKLINVGEAQNQLSGLTAYGITLNDTVFTASQRVDQVRKNLTAQYLATEDPAAKTEVTQRIQTLEERRRWLGRFYNPDRRKITIQDTRQALTARLAVPGLAPQQAAKIQADLTQLDDIEVMLSEAMKAQSAIDFENFKTSLIKQARKLNDPEAKAALQARIEALKFEDFTAQIGAENFGFFQSLLADVSISTATQLFLYADVSLTEFGQPLLFEWDLGDGQTRFGQNIAYAYPEPGFYRAELTVSDGVSSRQDLLTIKVLSTVE